MIRRTVLTIGVAGGALAAGLAFAAEISRGRLHFAERATLFGRAFTAVPASPGSAADKAARLLASPNESPPGEFCRFPPPDTGAVAVAATDTLKGGVARLLLEGQSTIPDSLPPALCVGQSATAPTAPQHVVRP